MFGRIVRTLSRRPIVSVLGASASFMALSSATFADGLSNDEFRSITCIENTAHTHDTRKIKFALPSGNWTVAGAIANILVRVGGAAQMGSCCACCSCGPDCSCPIEASGCCGCCECSAPCGCPKLEKAGSGGVNRNYNPLDAEEEGSLTILVKKYPNGKMGSALHALSPGEQVEAKGPNQQFSFPLGKHKHVGMLAGGTGLTPLIQCARYVLKNDTADVTLVCFNHTRADALLFTDLLNLQQVYPGRLRIKHFFTQEDVEPQTYGAWNVLNKGGNVEDCTVASGRVTPALIQASMPAPGTGGLVLACGRREMTDAIAGPKNKDWSQGPVGGMLAELGYSEKEVFKL